jgi:hypothetical protein
MPIDLQIDCARGVFDVPLIIFTTITSDKKTTRRWPDFPEAGGLYQRFLGAQAEFSFRRKKRK